MIELILDTLICLTDLKHYVKHKQNCMAGFTQNQDDCDCGANSIITRTNNLIEKIKNDPSLHK